MSTAVALVVRGERIRAGDRVGVAFLINRSAGLDIRPELHLGRTCFLIGGAGGVVDGGLPDGVVDGDFLHQGRSGMLLLLLHFTAEKAFLHSRPFLLLVRRPSNIPILTVSLLVLRILHSIMLLVIVLYPNQQFSALLILGTH